ncbi:TatD family hydrolase [Mycoplasma suis]|uniref:Hydrolase, TatD family n=1 Tax=Mycoplasma suis (strain Illinois) TaxID=768700 RepID=F0QRA9_MYCSL|nr:TatD family hydrolase [Mycoplasma suis]ADX98029.1 hydrolase, TatD family [Mycoplasma suis str. Illinois]
MTKENRVFETHIHLSHIENNLELRKRILFESSFFYLNVATTLAESSVVVKQSREFSNVFAAVGVHPLYLDSLEKKEEVLSSLQDLINKNREKIVAIGEVGLDFFKTNSPEDWEIQKKWFREYIELSIRNKLPLVLHLRNAYSEALKILREYSNLRGIIHSFDGNMDELKQFLSLDGEWFISFSPLVFRNFSKFRELIKWIDIKKVLVESDSPYLAQNQCVCRAILRLISDWKNLKLIEVKKTVFENSLRVFQLDIEKQ